MKNLKNKKFYLLDMDGTIYLDQNLFDGVTEFLEHIKRNGGKYMFVTNNSSKSVDKYIEKLKSLGIKAFPDDFLTSTNATIIDLKKRTYNKIYTFGTESFKEQLKEANIPITDVLEDDIDCLCMGFDTELTFKKLEDACILLNRGVDYIATNPDWVCPTWYGYVPDCGSVSEMLYNATKRRPRFIGKPQPEMINLAVEQYGFSKDETIIFGDRLYTDIASGFNAGVTTAFVLSGEGTMEDVEKSDIKPDFIFENIKEYYESVMISE
ncbi:MAG: HAD-IIA family hydrolase [Ruminococcaceae bacterium]|nr:HAD-IIA family hydrolase [Oscillospiraceae bacterium]